MRLIAVLLMLFPFATMATFPEENRNEPKKETTPVKRKKNRHFEFPLFIIGIGAGAAACWIWCDLPKDEPPPNPGPALKVTPDNLSDKPTFYQFRSR